MNIRKANFIDFFYKRRLLDGYISILGITLWYKIMAVYHSSLHIFYLCLGHVFIINFEYHIGSSYGTVHFPRFIVELKLLKWEIYNNARKTYDELEEWYEKYHNESLAKEAQDKAKQEEKDRLFTEYEQRILSLEKEKVT